MMESVQRLAMGSYLILLITSGAALGLPALDPAFKFLLVATSLLLAIRYGLELRNSLPGLCFLLAVYLSSVLSLAYTDTASLQTILTSTVSIGTPFLLLCVRSSALSTRTLQYFLIALPFASLALSIAFIPVGRLPVVQEYTGAWRLRASLIPPHFAMLLLCSLSATVPLSIRDHRTHIILLQLFILALIAATGTRGAMVAACFIFLPILFSQTAYLVRKRRLAALLVVASFVLMILGIAGYYVVIRSAQQLSSESINFSGRSVAWQFFFREFMESPIYGGGLGSVLQVTKGIYLNNLSAFLVPHNEFLRFGVDLGVLGSMIFLGAWIYHVCRVLLHPKEVRFYGLFLVLGYLSFAAVDNPISTPQMAYPWIVFLIFWQKYYGHS